MKHYLDDLPGIYSIIRASVLLVSILSQCGISFPENKPTDIKPFKQRINPATYYQNFFVLLTNNITIHKPFHSKLFRRICTVNNKDHTDYFYRTTVARALAKKVGVGNLWFKTILVHVINKLYPIDNVIFWWQCFILIKVSVYLNFTQKCNLFQSLVRKFWALPFAKNSERKSLLVSEIQGKMILKL